MTNKLRPNLPPPPPRIARLPVDERGYPVPFFVAIVDGKPDHRVADPKKLERAIVDNRCWVCGERLGQFLAFVIGPMCAVNRVSSEPPTHRECALYSAQACPFLTTPKQKRRAAGMPEDTLMSPTALERNPGVALVWMTKSYRRERGLAGEVLFRIGEPTECFWFAEGRIATRAEVEHSVTTGLPELRRLADLDGARAHEQLDRQLAIAQDLFPAL